MHRQMRGFDSHQLHRPTISGSLLEIRQTVSHQRALSAWQELCCQDMMRQVSSPSTPLECMELARIAHDGDHPGSTGYKKVRVSARMDSFCRLTLRWDGVWTGGRWLEFTFELDKDLSFRPGVSVLVTGETATYRRSSFFDGLLGL